jgi:pimeloyl-ACP methyl ester carboxylesterase
MTTLKNALSLPKPSKKSRAGAGESLPYLAIGLAAGAGVSSLVAGSAASLGAYFARQVVMPARFRVPDTEILAVIDAGERQEVVLGATVNTTVEGTYGLWFDDGQGFAQVGEVLEYVPGEGSVTRRLNQVYMGDIKQAVNGYWTGSLRPTPDDMGLPFEEQLVPVEGGDAPAWHFPAQTSSTTTAIIIHGRGASRAEGLRAVPALLEVGLNCLVISYRNDGEAPTTPDGRYALGDTEWMDVESAIVHAKSLGAKDIVLVGYSMGGAIALQTTDRSAQAKSVRALILDGPVINWVDVLAHHAKVNRIPSHVGRFGQWLLANKAGRRLTGLASPLNLKGMNWVERADQLRTPTLILHSAQDEVVPYGPSAALAEKNPEMVTLERFTSARHTKEYNVDPERWNKTVKTWLTATLESRREPSSYRSAE